MNEATAAVENENPPENVENEPDFSALAEEFAEDDDGEFEVRGGEEVNEEQEEEPAPEQTPEPEPEPEVPPAAEGQSEEGTEGEGESEGNAEASAPEQTPPSAEEQAPAASAEEGESEGGESEPPAVDYEKLREQAVEEIQSRFTLSEDDAQELLTEPNKVLPKLAAQLYIDVFENVTNGLLATMPQVVNNILEQRNQAQELERAFFGKWKQLDANNAQHVDAVRRIGATYRQLNPNASPEQFIAEVGAQVLMSLGIPFEEIVDRPAETPPPPRPARPGASAARPASGDNPFAKLAEEFMLDE